MVKLPTRDTAFGERPSTRSGRQVARIHTPLVGEGFADIGKGLTQLGAGIAAGQNENDSFEAASRILDFDSAQARALDDSRRTLTGDPTGFADQTRQAHYEGASEVMRQAREAGLSARALQNLELGLRRSEQRIRSRALDAELDQRGIYREDWARGQIEQSLQDYLRADSDERREEVRQRAEAAIEAGRRGGMPAVAERRLRPHLDRFTEVDLEQYATRVGPYEALTELREGDPRNRTPSTGNISQQGLAAVVAERAGGRQLPPQEAASLTRQVGTQAAEISKWIGENVTAELTQAQHDALVSFGIRSGKDALPDLLPAINAGNLSSTVANTQGDLTSAEQPADIMGTAPPASRGERRGLLDVTPIPGPPRNVRPRQASVEGIVLHHTAGSSLEGAISHGRRSNTGANYYVDRDGSIRQWGDDDQRFVHIRDPGGRSRNGQWPNLTNDNTIGIEVVARNNGDITPEQRTSIAQLVGTLAQRHNIDPQNIVGHGDIQGGPGGNRERDEGAIASEFRSGRLAQAATTMTDATPGARLPGETERPGIFNQDESDALRNRLPSSRFSRMPFDRRQATIHKLEQAARGQVQPEVEDDLIRIERTGEPRRLADGTTWFDRASRVYTELQRANLNRRIQDAYGRFRAVNGLPHMTPDEMDAHVERLSPSNRLEGDSLRSAQRARDYAANMAERLKQARNADSAAAVSGIVVPPSGRMRTRYSETGQAYQVPDQDDIRGGPEPEVAAVYRNIVRRNPELEMTADEEGNVSYSDDSRQMSRAAILQRITDERLTADERAAMMDARIAAAARLGIADYNQRGINRQEADDILNMPANVSEMGIGEFTSRLKAAADRAEDLFGRRYAITVLVHAMQFRRIGANSDQAYERNALIARLVRGENVTGRNVMGSNLGEGITELDLMRMNSLDEINRIGRLWEGPVGGGLDNFGAQREDRPAIMPNTGVMERDVRRQAGEVQRQPNDAQRQWLLQNIEERAATFDQMFGRGAAARIVGEGERRR